MPFSPEWGCGPADLGTVVRCFGEDAAAKHSPCTREARFAPPRNTRGRANALSNRELRIRAGRLAQEGRNTCAAGATPPKTALACANRPFGEVAPGNFPWRKAARPRGAAEAFAAGVRTVTRRSPVPRSALRSRPPSIPGPARRRAPCRVARRSCARSRGPLRGRRPTRAIPGCKPGSRCGCAPAPPRPPSPGAARCARGRALSPLPRALRAPVRRLPASSSGGPSSCLGWYCQVNERQFRMWQLGTLLIGSNASTWPPSGAETEKTGSIDHILCWPWVSPS